ncbi:MAG TPA: Mur ligase family protein [Candidatus Limnocylindrales bacterium]|nr:Mur ligase family protein [Candidatus Limnocylindrales bacterium]
MTVSSTRTSRADDYPAAVRELTSRGRFGISLGLQRIEAILDELDHPERSLHGALVGGTNGKGSVVAMARSVLRAAGLRIGTMPKPHLVSYRERIAIDGLPLDEERFAAAVARVLPATDRVAERLGPPTEFETLTAAAFTELAVSDVDLVLVEVGMGGRLDATNVLDPGVALITNVQLDHERYLGRTLAAIGAEKAAIIKRGDLAVTGATGRGLRPIVDRAAELATPLRLAGPGHPYGAELRHAGWDGLVVDAATPDSTLRGLRIGLLGGHQAQNAAVALALLDALRQDGERRGAPLIGLDESATRRGFADARWPGRMELLPATAHGRVLLDGAHNPAGARALAAALGELDLRGFPLVFGAMRGKRVTAVLRALAPLQPKPIFTRVADAVVDAGARSPESLLAAWRRVAGDASAGRTASEPGEAMRQAAAWRTDDEQPIVVAGSLYLVGAVRARLMGEEAPT